MPSIVILPFLIDGLRKFNLPVKLRIWLPLMVMESIQVKLILTLHILINGTLQLDWLSGSVAFY